MAGNLAYNFYNKTSIFISTRVGQEHCLAPGNNTGIRGLLPSINEVVMLDTIV